MIWLEWNIGYDYLYNWCEDHAHMIGINGRGQCALRDGFSAEKLIIFLVLVPWFESRDCLIRIRRWFFNFSGSNYNQEEVWFE